jgi:hypothetical protein
MVTTSALGGAEACSGKAFAFFFFLEAVALGLLNLDV